MYIQIEWKIQDWNIGGYIIEDFSIYLLDGPGNLPETSL